VDAEADRQVTLLQELIAAARNIRAELKLDPKRRVAAAFSSEDPAVRALVEMNRDVVLRLATLSDLHISAGHLDPHEGPVRATSQFDMRIAYGDAVDTQAELARLRKEKERLAATSTQKRIAWPTRRFAAAPQPKSCASLRRPSLSAMWSSTRSPNGLPSLRRPRTLPRRREY